MEIIRIYCKQHGIKYFTEDCKYRIWKPCKKADWEFSEFSITERKYKTIKCFKHFNDARRYLKSME